MGRAKKQVSITSWVEVLGEGDKAEVVIELWNMSHQLSSH